MLPKTLISTAVLGTAQQSPEAVGDPAVDSLIAQLDPNDPAARLLLTSAALGLQQKAGWLADHDPSPLPAPCPPDANHTCRPRAAQHLLLMLEGHYIEALPEWLREISKAGQRAPEESLPLLLDLGYKQHDWRHAIWPVLGNRGRWLADQVKERYWHWAAAPAVDQWATWSNERQVAAFEAWRRTDPAAAREFLQGKLAGEDWESRKSLLNCLAVGLSLADEPFLESALADNSQAVRHAVAELLGALPGSQLSQRMTGRATQYLTLAWKGLPRKPLIEVTLPSELDADMTRDGFLPVAPFLAKDASPAQHWLSQVISYLPLSFWVAHWKLPIGGVVGAGHTSKESTVLFSAWAEAVKRETDAGFMAELLTALFNHEHNAKKKGVETAHLLRTAVGNYRGRWTDDLTDAFVAGLHSYLGQGSQRPSPEIRQMLQPAMYRMPTSKRDQIVEALHRISADKGWSDLVDEIALVLTFRHNMLNAIWHDSPESIDSDDLPYLAGATP